MARPLLLRWAGHFPFKINSNMKLINLYENKRDPVKTVSDKIFSKFPEFEELCSSFVTQGIVEPQYITNKQWSVLEKQKNFAEYQQYSSHIWEYYIDTIINILIRNIEGKFTIRNANISKAVRPAVSEYASDVDFDIFLDFTQSVSIVFQLYNNCFFHINFHQKNHSYIYKSINSNLITITNPIDTIVKLISHNIE